MTIIRILLLAVLLAPAGCAAPPRAGQRLPYLNVEEAVAASEESGRMILVDVYAPWCGWCRRMARESYRDPVLTRFIREHFIVARLDGDDEETRLQWRGTPLTPSQIALRLGAVRYPTTVFLEPGGERVAVKVSGYLNRREFARLLRYVSTGAYRSTPFRPSGAGTP